MPRLFELIETPEPGWETRKIKRVRHLGAEPEWLVQLARERDGLQVQHQHESLHVAYFRASEAAHAHEAGLNAVVDREALDDAYRAEQRALKAP